MNNNAKFDLCVLKNGRKLRCGYTTGSCAAAASKAAAMMLLSGEKVDRVQLMTPKGILLDLEILEITIEEDYVQCAVQKVSGDDPDVTDGLLVFARVSRTVQSGLEIDGGEGVGRVTKPGLWQKPGKAAINRVPMRMIEEEVTDVIESFHYTGGIRIVIFVPGGEAIARKTFNPRLGIMGGISILGTSGIVMPMSETALIESIRLEISVRAAAGEKYLLVSPGNYGQDYIQEKLGLDIDRAVKYSNFVGEMLDMVVEQGFEGILLVSHIGKLIKVAGGIMNTHSQAADSRMEIIAAQALLAGADRETAVEILNSLTTDEAVSMIKDKPYYGQCMKQIADKIYYYMAHRTYSRLKIGAIMFSNVHGELTRTDQAAELLSIIRNQQNHS